MGGSNFTLHIIIFSKFNMILPQTENGTDHNIICSLYLISTTLAIITHRWQLCAEQYATWIDSCNLFLSLYIYANIHRVTWLDYKKTSRTCTRIILHNYLATLCKTRSHMIIIHRFHVHEEHSIRVLWPFLQATVNYHIFKLEPLFVERNHHAVA